jgi:hypothetical protein
MSKDLHHLDSVRRSSRLHHLIMNLQIEPTPEEMEQVATMAGLVTGEEYGALEAAFQLGAKKARHAAAELVVNHESRSRAPTATERAYSAAGLRAAQLRMGTTLIED